MVMTQRNLVVMTCGLSNGLAESLRSVARGTFAQSKNEYSMTDLRRVRACTASSSLLYVRLKQKSNKLRTAYHEVNHTLTYVLSKHKASLATTSVQLKEADFFAIELLTAILKSSVTTSTDLKQAVSFDSCHSLVFSGIFARETLGDIFTYHADDEKNFTMRKIFDRFHQTYCKFGPDSVFDPGLIIA